MSESASVVIIGSGVAGTFLANWFYAQGIRDLLVLEAGPKIPMADPAWWYYHVAQGGGTGNTPYAACYDLPADIVATGLEPWSIVGGRLFGGGGTTLHWGGWIPRFMPEDFRLFTNTGQGIDWPYSYADLEPFYCKAEHYVGASGDSREQTPPRGSAYPYDAAPYPISAAPFIKAFDDLGISYGHLPMARYGQAHGDAGPCRTTGTCNYCPVSGRFTGDLTLGKLFGLPGLSIKFNSPVLEVRMKSKSEAAGVSYWNADTRQAVDVDAAAVIVCSGAMETPKLLMRSGSPFWTRGIGNDHDLLGRFLSATQFFYASGKMPNPQGFQEELGFPSLYSRAFDSPEHQKAGKLFLTMNYKTPNVDIAALMAAGKDVAAIRAARTAPADFQLYGNLSAIPQFENRVTPAPGQNRYFLPRTAIDTPAPLYNPVAAAEYSSIMQKVLAQMGCADITAGTYPQRGDHAACTTRMATTEAQGVVNTELQVFGTDNVFVLGNGVMPTLPAANPTLTLIAMAYKAVSDPKGAIAALARKLTPAQVGPI